MLTDDQRATLQAIASSHDPEVRPSDRLKALEMLAGEERHLDDPLRHLSDDQLVQEVDALRAASLQDAFGDPATAKRYPQTMAVLKAEIERREADRRAGRDPDRDWIAEYLET